MVLGLSLILGSMGAGPSASAEGPASVFPGAVFYGYVFAETPGTLPERVRAMGAAGAVCGSADIVRVNDSAGFYALSVVSSDLKRGCPPRNGVVQFSLLTGRVDDGVWAEQVAMLEQRETPELLNLSLPSRVMPNWLGLPSNVDGGSLLRWTGGRSSLATALAALPYPAGDAYRLDEQSGLFVVALSDTTIESGDLVLVRFR